MKNSPLQYLQYLNGRLGTDGVSFSSLAKEYGTPLYVYSQNALINPLQELQQGLQGLDHLICFASKSNSNLSILKLLSHSGAGLDIVTGGELFRALRTNIPGHKIVFSGVGKSQSEIEAALHYQNTGIYSFNVESIPELAVINRIAQKTGKKAAVALRFNPDVNAKTHPYISTGLKKNKFGIDKKEILKIVSELHQYPAIELNGISIHIGSQILTLAPLDEAFEKLKGLIQQITPLLPKPLAFVDLGGGIGISYKNEKTPSLRQYCALIQKHFGKKNQKQFPLKILIEPGRSLSGNAGVLLTQVLYRKTRKNKDFLIVDAGMNDLMRPSLYGSYHEIVPLHQVKGKIRNRKFDIVGPVCESGDCFAHDRILPDTIQEGDYLAILSAGAYGFTMASNYNTRPRPAEVLVNAGKNQIIRKRETFEDLIRGESI